MQVKSKKFFNDKSELSYCPNYSPGMITFDRDSIFNFLDKDSDSRHVAALLLKA